MKTTVKLTTERMCIRLSTDAEMQELITNTEDEGLKLAYTEMLTMAREHPESRPWYGAWFIEDIGGERVGELCFKGLSPDGITEIGYGILPEFQGKGYATETVKTVTQWALSQPGVTCITAETEANNAASQKVLVKAGFTATGEYGEEGPLFALMRKLS